MFSIHHHLIESPVFSSTLIAWYQAHKRDLPWRHTQNPYYIWLSEVILQQTRVAQGLPYYLKFVENYPTVIALAEAPSEDVLRLWQGLGYYSRARNLHETAKIITKDYQGIFPDNYQDLLKLKGIGPYTAAAVASLAFDQQVAVVDGNVYRVLSRIFGIETDIASSQAPKEFAKLANELISSTQPAEFNQAIMEFGALQCVPVSPQCMFCVFNENCVANNTGKVSKLPVKSKKLKVKERFFNYIVLEQNQQIWMKKRPLKDIWAEMYDFMLLESDEPQSLDQLAENPLIRQVLAMGILKNQSQPVVHILTHQKIYTVFWHITINQSVKVLGLPNMQSYSLDQIDDLPKSTLVNNYLKEHFF